MYSTPHDDARPIVIAIFAHERTIDRFQSCWRPDIHTPRSADACHCPGVQGQGEDCSRTNVAEVPMEEEAQNEESESDGHELVDGNL